MKKIAFSLIASALLATSALAQEKVVNVYNWSDYVDPTVLEDFTKATGIKVVYDTYDNNEIVETKLLAGKSGYDIVVPSGPFLQRLIEQKVFLPIDRAKVPEIKNAWPEIEKRLQAFDPGNKFAVNYMWGTTGLGYNVAKIKQRLGNTPIDSWDIVLKPENLAKLKDCGVMMLDAPEDIFPGVLRALGLDPDSKKAADYQKAADALMKVRGNVRKFHSSEYINALANGDICFVVGYSGDILQKDAGNVDEAYTLIDFLLRLENAARNTTASNFANGVLASKPLVPTEITGNRSIYPDDEVMSRLFTVSPPDRNAQRTITREWTRVKTGR